QYHFAGQKVSPFLGLGLNYTRFFDAETKGPLAGNDLDLDASWGLAAHAGLDFAIRKNQWLRLDARWIYLETAAKLNGRRPRRVDVDPLGYGAAFVWAF